MRSTWVNVCVTISVPIIWLAIRFTMGLAGWVVFIYMMYGILAYYIVGGILVTAIKNAKDVPDLGKAPLFYYASVACHLASAVAFNDFGDAPDSARYSPISQVFGDPVGDAAGLVLMASWIIFAVATLVAIIIAKRRHRQKWRETRDPNLFPGQ